MSCKPYASSQITMVERFYCSKPFKMLLKNFTLMSCFYKKKKK